MSIKSTDTSRLLLSRARGFTLIEVLITFLVLAIGLVGLASLQITALRSTHSSLLTTTASAAALDFEERAWIELSKIPPTATTGCVDFTTLKTDFIANWKSAPDQFGIPDLDVAFETVTTDPAAWTERRLLLSWPEGRFSDVETTANASGPRESFAFTVRVPCLVSG